MIKVIGILDSASLESRGEELAAFQRGLRKFGVNGSNAQIVYRWADHDDDLLNDLAGQLGQQADVIVAAGGPGSALAAKQYAPNTPIVFTTVANPVKSQLVQSIPNPGGNVTGTFGHTTECEQDRMRALLELLGQASVGIGVLMNPKRPYPKNGNLGQQKRDLEDAARGIGSWPSVEKATNKSEIDRAFVEFERLFKDGEIVGVLITADPLLSSLHKHIIDHAARTGIPTIYQWPDFVKAGGLMSYGPTRTEGYENAGEYAARIILRNENPATMRVKETDIFEPVVNRKVAESVGVHTIPNLILHKRVRVI